MATKWQKLLCSRKELQLLGTLNGGQSFRWKKQSNEQVVQWIGVFSDRVWVLKQEDEHILYKVYSNKSEPNYGEEHETQLLRDYFQLDLNLEQYYKQWSESDRYFKEAAKQFYGIRILKQDVVENIFSFICSSNNNISRISSMVEKLAKYYGEKICEIDGEEFYSFPNINALTVEGVETKLRDNGFGYRAKYISKSAEYIAANGGDDWLQKLKKMEYDESKRTLMELTGIGAKVADCICLMSLGHLQAIPVDTHIYQIAARLYMPKLAKQKTVTEKIYNEIGDNFRNLYGPLAGWAHTVLFCADLKKFQGANQKSYNDTKAKKRKV